MVITGDFVVEKQNKTSELVSVSISLSEVRVYLLLVSIIVHLKIF